MQKEIILYTYYISDGRIDAFHHKVVKETEKSYHTTSPYNAYNNGILKKTDDGKVILKSKTKYPYIDFFDSKNPSRERAVKKITEFLKKDWGLNTQSIKDIR